MATKKMVTIIQSSQATGLQIAALFSGGKDSVYSLYLSQKAGHVIKYLVTAYAKKDSYMYHVPAIKITELAAKAMEVEQIKFHAGEEDELSPLRDALADLEIEGVCFGAVASNYQRTRITRICDQLGLRPIMPLWHKDPTLILNQMIDDGFEILIVAVAAMGLDEYWLGQVLDRSNIDEFMEVCKKNRIHPLGEGGEYETMVLSGPHMGGKIHVEFEKKWYGASGEVEITKAWLEDAPTRSDHDR
jgi:diphthine-ammonia ligase